MTIDSIKGSILGCAVGDALGLPYEHLSRKRAVRLFGEPTKYRFLPGKGMISDDTEHTCLVAQSLCRYPDDLKGFTKSLRWGLRWWFVGVPAGIGKATARACVRLWLGFSRSGVYSMGNGPAMRAGILGASIDDLAKLKEYITASTEITHIDPKANEGALAIGLAAWCARKNQDTPTQYLPQLRAFLGDISDDCEKWLQHLETAFQKDLNFEDFLILIQCEKRISGYMFHTVPAVLYLWLKSPDDLLGTIQTLIRAGGDTDSTAAMVGSIIGAKTGPEVIPEALLKNLWEWPRGVSWMKRLAQTLTRVTETQTPESPPFVVLVVSIFRNFFFFGIVLLHVVRRLFPPY